MKASELMRKQVAFCGCEANLAQAVEMISQNPCGCLPVIGDGGDVIGLITDRDLSFVLGTEDQRASEIHVGDIMALKVTACTTDDQDCRRVNQHLKTFAYSVSHDLQGPLRTIARSAQLLKRSCGNRLQPDEAGFLARIFTVADRMLALVSDLAVYSEAARHVEVSVPAIDSARVLADVLETLSAPIEAAGAIVTSASLPLVSMHGPRLALVFQNLISNAIKYRSGTPRIHISARLQENWCVFSVADNGIGIEPQFSRQIFEPFKRLHSRDQYPGSGLGLAICQRTVEQYGGRIWVEKSSLGEGSTFCFAVPFRTWPTTSNRLPSQPLVHEDETPAVLDSLRE